MKFNSEQPKILIVGSSSIDLVLNTEKFPQANETIMAIKSETFFGGKGANQAVGTARLGANTMFIGCVGMDPYGQQILRNLIDENVNVGFVHEDVEIATGTAYVTAAEGKNAIIIIPSANHSLLPDHIEQVDKFFMTADLVLVQLEIPMVVIETVYKKCKKYGVRLGIYAAPAHRLSQEIIDYATFIVLKTNDLSVIFDKNAEDEILKEYPNKVFLRDEGNSTIYYNGTEMRFYRNDIKEMPNKMGMGDAFISGFSVAYCHGNNIDDCVKFGNDVSLKVSKERGSQKGLPYLKDFGF